MMKTPDIKVPDAPAPPISPTAFSGKKKPNTGNTPTPTFLGSESAPQAGQTAQKQLLGQ